ncbi:41225_t:CDS:2 [Gigaspora margarita]|uniref:41225_t:CDS:1 n=1 Tax=Gigaspora margarita TaxID=4874 RepID=A0ABN7UXU6_GIGMA|nr:41225_t:CDS:2 [Gigaspora margarita]
MNNRVYCDGPILKIVASCWKLESLLNWAEKESIAIIGITETNLAEREGNFLAHSTNKKYKGYWSSATEEKKKGSGIGIKIEEQWEKHVDHFIPKADGVSNNKSIYATERQNSRDKTPTKNCRSCFQKEKSDANSHYG